MDRTTRFIVRGALLSMALHASGCTSCSYSPPFSEVAQGGTVYFEELSVPDCDDSSCRLVIDVVNSYQVAVRTLFDGDPADLPSSVAWDTRDETGAMVPSDVYVMRAKLNGSRVDSWTVIVRQGIADATTETGGEP